MATTRIVDLNAATKQEIRDVCFMTTTATMTGSTPNVADTGTFKTANTGATVISNFTGGKDGQRIVVMINDANTTLNFSTGSLKGNGGVNWVAAVGDSFTAVYDLSTTTWYCQIETTATTGTATELGTTGLAVNIAASAAPSVGQVLKATSATTATWQDATNIATHLEGQKMIFNPNNFGDYADTDAVIAATPAGGTLELINDYDVALYGVITVNKGITITGQGWGKADDTSSSSGTIIDNTSVTPEANCIIFTTNLSPDLGLIRNPVVKNLWIKHNGTGYAIIYDNTAWGEIDNCDINLNGTGYGGIHLSNTTASSTRANFYIIIKRLWIREFTGIGIWFDECIGSKSAVIDCHIKSEDSASINGIRITGNDTKILNTQAEAASGPGIYLYIPATYAKDIYGILIEGCICESAQPLIQTHSANSDRWIRQCIFRNINMIPNNVTDYYIDLGTNTKDCILEYPLPYSNNNGGAYNGYLAKFRADTQDNKVIAHGANIRLKYADAGTNNIIEVEHASDKHLCYANNTWPEGTGTQYAVSESNNTMMFRSANSSAENIANVWETSGKAFATPSTIEGCLFWLDADDLSTMWQVEDGTSPVTADAQEVLAWDSKVGSETFNVQERIISVTKGLPTIVSIEFAGKESSIRTGDSVTIANISGTPNLNGTHTATYVGANSFSIPVDSTTGSYTYVGAYAKNDANTPVYEDDVLSLGIPGVLFNGVDDFLNGPIAALGGNTGTIMAVSTLTDTTTTGTLRAVLGRSYNTDSIRLANLSSYVQSRCKLEGIDQNLDTIEPAPSERALFSEARTNATDFSTSYAFQDETVLTSGGTFTKDAHHWQVGANGSTNLSFLFKGYIHSVAIFDRELTEFEMKQLRFYFTNKYKGIVKLKDWTLP